MNLQALIDKLPGPLRKRLEDESDPPPARRRAKHTTEKVGSPPPNVAADHEGASDEVDTPAGETPPPDTDVDTPAPDSEATEDEAESVETTAEEWQPLGDEDEEDLLSLDEADAEDLSVRLRKILLGVSISGVAVAVLAALVRRLLGKRAEAETDEADDEESLLDAEDEDEAEPETQPLEEGAAAALGMAFLLVVEALRDRLSSETPEN